MSWYGLKQDNTILYDHLPNRLLCLQASRRHQEVLQGWVRLAAGRGAGRWAALTRLTQMSAHRYDIVDCRRSFLFSVFTGVSLQLMRSLIVLVPLCLFISGSLGVGNTTCLSDRLDWYTDAVGETPCTTYQRLRQLCNSDYEVGAFSPKTPGDNCDDQVSACCCNSVSWALSMLCMNCQQDASASVNGIDAGKGAYQMYLHSGGNGELCSPMTNGSLPADIQQAVCNAGIKLDNFLYNLFWDDGSWFYSYTRESAETDQAANNNNTFTHCPNQAQSSGAPSATPNAPSSAGTPNTSTPSSSAPAGSPDPPASASSHGSRPPTAAIVVGTIGGLIALAALAVLVLLLRRRSAHVHVRARPVSLASCMAAASGSAGHTDPFALSAHTDPSVLSARTDPFVLAAPSAPRTPEKGARAPPASVSVLDSDYGYGYGCGYRVAYDARASEAALSDAGSRGDGGMRHEDGGLVLELVRSSSGRLPPMYEPLRQSGFGA